MLCLVFHQFSVATLLYFFVSESACLVNLVVRVAALEEEHFAVALESKDVRTDTVEEPAVVADHYGASGEAFKTFLQSAQRVHVDIVGRLVEQQHVASGCVRRQKVSRRVCSGLCPQS